MTAARNRTAAWMSWACAFVSVLTAVLLLLVPHTPVSRGLGGLFVLVLAGSSVATWLLPEPSRAGQILGWGLATSPLVFLGSGILAGGADRPAVVVLAAAASVSFAVRAITRSHGTTAGWRPRPEHLLGGGLAACVAVLTLASAAFWASYHGLLHSAVVYEILRGGAPPQNPYFAGEPLHYYWGYHLFAAYLVRIAGIDPLTALGWWRVLSGGLLVVVLSRIGRRFGITGPRAVIGAVAAMLGLNALGWVFLVPQAGAALELLGSAADRPLQILGMMTLGYNRRLGAGATIILNLSGFAPALAFGLLGVDRALIAGRSRAAAAAALACTCGAFVINPLGGASALLVGLPLVVGRVVHRRCSALRVSWGAASLCLGALLAAPYVLGLGAEETRELVRPALSTGRLWQLLWVLGPLALAAGLSCTVHPRRCFPLWLAAGTAAAFGTLLELPAKDEYYFLRAAALPLGILASGWISRRRPLSLVLLGVLLVPPAAITVAAYGSAVARPLPLAARVTDLVIVPEGRDEARAYAYLREQTPQDSVVVEPFGPGQLSFLPAQGSDVPSLARRRMFLGFMSGIDKKTGGMLLGGHSGLDQRVQTIERVFSPRTPPEALAAELQAIHRPCFLVLRDRSAKAARLREQLSRRPDLFRVVFDSHRITIVQPLDETTP